MKHKFKVGDYIEGTRDNPYLFTGAGVVSVVYSVNPTTGNLCVKLLHPLNKTEGASIFAGLNPVYFIPYCHFEGNI